MTEYRRYQGKSYMIITSGEALLGYEYPMITENNIAGLLPVALTNANEQVQFWYDISGKQTLEDWMKMKRSQKGFLKKFMTALAETLEQTREYLLSEDGVSLAPEKIFINIEETEIAFCYTPFQKEPFTKSLNRFMEYYLSHMEYEDRKEVKICCDAYERCRRECVVMEDVLQILYEEEEETLENFGYKQAQEWKPLEKESVSLEEPPIENAQKITQFLLEKRDFFKQRWEKRNVFLRKKKKPDERYFFEPQERQEENQNPTVFLGSETDEIIGELKYEGEGTGENMKIVRPVFFIGSQKGGADGVICSDTVSRIHARITKEDGGYYLEDMNSTNGTRRNGEELCYKEKVKLEKNDKIMFAKELYRFV